MSPFVIGNTSSKGPFSINCYVRLPECIWVLDFVDQVDHCTVIVLSFVFSKIFLDIQSRFVCFFV